jgi:hypothetical protein
LSLKREVHRVAKEGNSSASVFEEMISASNLSAHDMKLVLENHNVHMSVQRIENSSDLISIIDVLLGGKNLWVS